MSICPMEADSPSYAPSLQTHPRFDSSRSQSRDASEDVISVIRAGARGYVTKNISGPDLLDAIYRVAAGDAVFSPRLAGFVLDAFSLEGATWRRATSTRPRSPYPRERQVLRLIARGYSYRDIASELSISAKTVESHVSSVLRKLQLSNRHQLSNWASQRHLQLS